MAFRGLWGLTQATFPSSCPSIAGVCALLLCSRSFLSQNMPFSHRPLSLCVSVPTDYDVLLLSAVYLKNLWFFFLSSGLLTFSVILTSQVDPVALSFVFSGHPHSTYHILPGSSMNLWLSLFKMLIGKLWIGQHQSLYLAWSLCLIHASGMSEWNVPGGGSAPPSP